jgi:hypothetical protein
MHLWPTPPLHLKSMVKKDSIILHCSATKEGLNFDVTDIERWHRTRGFKAIGYAYVILLDGTIQLGRDLDQDGEVDDEIGAHALGHNKRSIGICYIGGLDSEGQPKDTRTHAQMLAMTHLVSQLKAKHGIEKVIGHNEISNKLCPCFNVQQWIKEAGI